MKIGNFEFTFGRKANNAADSKPVDNGHVLKRIVRTQLVRSQSQVKDWTTATNAAESIINPQRTELIRIYNNISVDTHLSALLMTLRLKVLGANWRVATADQVDDDATAIVKTTWFRSILEAFIDSEIYGYSLLQLTPIDNGFQVEQFPREYIIPERRAIKKQLSQNANSTDLINIDDPEFAAGLIFADSGTLGLLHKAAPVVIMKRAVLSAWSEYAEIFGMPVRVGRTDIRDPTKYKNMDKMLSDMGSAMYAVLDPSDKLEFVETSKGDAFQVFNEFLKMSNSELSKLVLGQTGTTDEKAFAGSAGVHAAVLDDIIASIVQKMANWVNGVVVPKLVAAKLLTANQSFVVVNENRLTADEKLRALQILLTKYTIDPEVIEAEFGIQVTEKPDPAQQTTSAAIPDGIEGRAIMKVVSKLYADALHDCGKH